MDIFDTDQAIVLRAELPGLTAEDIDIEIDDNVLTLKGERRFEETVEEGRYYRLERAYGHFQRNVTLPQGVKADEISASFDNGVLSVRVPKADEIKPAQDRRGRRRRARAGRRGRRGARPPPAARRRDQDPADPRPGRRSRRPWTASGTAAAAEEAVGGPPSPRRSSSAWPRSATSTSTRSSG